MGLAMFLMALLAASSTEAGKRYALLVAINRNHITDGELRNLEYAISDANKLKAVLLAQGFDEATALVDEVARRETILKELNWHARTLKADDEFILFYSGHGVKNTVVNDQSYWMTYAASMSELDASSIRLSHLIDYVREMKPRRKLVLLDHCFSGDVIEQTLVPAAAGGGARDAQLPPLRLDKAAQIVKDELESQVKAQGLVVLAAARNLAFESTELKQGVFTQMLLDALTSRKADKSPSDGRLSVQELASFVVPWFQDYKGPGKQVPVEWQSGANLGDWILAPNLPTDANDVQQRVSRYETTLGEWEVRYITFDTRTRALSILNRWQKAEVAGAKLPDAEGALLAKILEALDNDGPEDGRARALELLFKPGVR